MFEPLESKINQSNINTFSSCLTENTASQSVNTPQENNRPLFWESCQFVYTQSAKFRVILMLKQAGRTYRNHRAMKG
jgi:hypothetical protein